MLSTALAVILVADAGTSALDSLNGFQKATWGMTLEQVKAAAGEYRQKQTIAGHPMEIVFTFDEKGLLNGVAIQRDSTGRDKASDAEVLKALRESLVSKYGSPTTDQSVRDVSAIEWVGPKTTIHLGLAGLLFLTFAPAQKAPPKGEL